MSSMLAAGTTAFRVARGNESVLGGGGFDRLRRRPRGHLGWQLRGGRSLKPSSLYTTWEQAEAAREDVLADEPEWRGLVTIERVEVGEGSR